MTELTVELDDGAAEQLRRRAQRERVDPAQLAARLRSAAAVERDPYDCGGSFESDVVGARDVDAFLRERGFGIAIVDTGPLVAAASRKEPDHPACRDRLTKAPGQLTIPALVVAETTFMLSEPAAHRLRPASCVPSDQQGSGLRRHGCRPGPCGRPDRAVRRSPLGGTDATVIALAERLGESDAAILDHQALLCRTPTPRFTLLP